MADAAVAPPPLKHLGPVPDTVAKAASVAQNIYLTARKYVPGVLEPYLSRTEEVVSQYGAPLVTAAADYGSKLLYAADNTVAKQVSTASSLHAEGLQHFNKAKEDSFAWVEATVKYIRDLLNPFPYINAVLDPIKSTVSKTVNHSDPDAAVDYVMSYISKLASFGPVSSVLHFTEPYQKAVADLVSYIVKHPLYKQAVDTALSVYGKVFSIASHTWLYKTLAEYLYPQVSFVVDPVYSKVQHSKYVAEVLDAVKPKSA